MEKSIEIYEKLMSRWTFGHFDVFSISTFPRCSSLDDVSAPNCDAVLA